jgi:hypothetical protein
MKTSIYSLLLAAFVLCGCASPVQLNLGPNQKASLTDLPAESAAALTLVDDRTDADRAGSKTAGLIWLGDKELEPPPPVAVGRELKRALANRLGAAYWDEIHTSSLKKFDVAVQWRDMRNQGHQVGMPGMVAVDYMLRGAMQMGMQMTFVLTVRVEIEVDAVTYKTEAAALHPADAGAIRLQALVRKASEQIAEKVVSQYKERLGGR